MKRTSLMLEDLLLMEIRELAQQTGRTLKEQIHLLLREGLRVQKDNQKKKFKLNLPVVKGDSPPKIDIASRDELFEVFDN